MAATSRGAQLTEQHRQAQQQVKQSFLVEFLALWSLLDSTRLDATGSGWVAAVMRLIRPFRLRSAEISTQYYSEFRGVEAPTSVPRPRIEVPRFDLPTSLQPAPTAAGRRIPQRSASIPGFQVTPRDRRVRFEFDETPFQPRPERRTRIDIPDIDWSRADRAAEVSLIVTGPVGQKAKAARGKLAQTAQNESLVEASGSASRHVLTGGRQSLLTLLEDDPQALGWARVTDGDPCAFCALLASRGPVYGSEDSAGFRAHDNCACTVEPVYSRQAPWPGRAAEFRRLYRDSTRDTSGRNSINAFRRAYEQQQRDARRGRVA